MGLRVNLSEVSGRIRLAGSGVIFYSLACFFPFLLLSIFSFMLRFVKEWASALCSCACQPFIVCTFIYRVFYVFPISTFHFCPDFFVFPFFLVLFSLSFKSASFSMLIFVFFCVFYCNSSTLSFSIR